MTNHPSQVLASPDVAFGSFVDLVRSKANGDAGEICEVCSTLNRSSAYFCKGCRHKLPPYYSASKRAPMLAWQRRQLAGHRAWLWDLAAIWIVLSLLVVVTANIPVL